MCCLNYWWDDENLQDCVMSALEKKTVVLVTHQVEFLPETDRILVRCLLLARLVHEQVRWGLDQLLACQVMEHGKVAQEGTYEQLLKSGTAFEQLVNAHQSSMNIIDSSSHGNQNLAESAGGGQEHDAHQPTKQESEVEISSQGLSAAQLTEDEETAIGDLGWKPYRDYLQVSKGYTLLVWMILLQSVFVLLQSLSGYWLAVVAQLQHVSGGILVGVYAVISILSCFFAYTRSLVAARQGLNASKAFFSSLMDSVFKAPMSFFDSTPVGRILTRVSEVLPILSSIVSHIVLTNLYVTTAGIL